MTIHFGFEPDAARARSLDRRMHASLATSLEHLCDVSRGHTAFDDAAIGRLVESLQAGDCYSPFLFRDYYVLADALFADEGAAAARQFERLSHYRPTRHRLVVEVLADPDRDEKSAIYRTMMTGGSEADMSIFAPDPEVGRRFVERFHRGMALMEEALPELAGEVRAIVREVVCAAGDPTKEMQIDGGSHFQLWGALLLNTDFHPTEQAIVEVVAHESAHSLLFGFCTDEPLVFNDDADLYPSPLRRDPRPMDGIYHATFVSARMHWAMSRLLESASLSEGGREEARAAREADRKNFEAGYTVVSSYGDLSETGQRLMEGARAYMDGVAA